ncbi:hypothetical protein OMP38_19560 [Cohnella ginsengisoli]|uniref:Uncharacterized protein n=1 Tax=Cohnella ginsengisoli TaxID=425004 RepID=A0A9X4KIJ5_9BACL|nr:hypothetical protein [Cohnella ginsengisoli]MDG0792822.1 hypothetical protein [Cohnella ginsengisoli]
MGLGLRRLRAARYRQL